MAEFRALIRVGEGVDPRPLCRVFTTDLSERSLGEWEVVLPSELHGLALINATHPDELTHFMGYHPVDPDGWADWAQAAPGENEMTSRLLPTRGNSGAMRHEYSYRYEDSYVWDPNAMRASTDLLRRLGLLDGAQEHLQATGGKGDWAFKALKWGARLTLAGLAKDVVLTVVEKTVWKTLQRQSAQSRAIYERQEHDRRILLQLAETRRERLETGSASSRRKARQYYTTLDALIAANS